MSWWLRRPEHRVAVAPSLLSADFTDIRSDIASMDAAGADLLHLDVMDAHFVPNLTFGPFICAAIRRCTDLILDAHLMMTRPDRYLEDFAKAGVDAITIHVESECALGDTLDRIRALGCRPGISLNPDTPVAAVEPWLDRIDLVLVMTVQPGFGGQSFDPRGLEKMRRLVQLRRARDLEFAVSVDGGVNDATSRDCREAGSDILVSGSWFCKSPDRSVSADILRGPH